MEYACERDTRQRAMRPPATATRWSMRAVIHALGTTVDLEPEEWERLPNRNREHQLRPSATTPTRRHAEAVPERARQVVERHSSTLGQRNAACCRRRLRAAETLRMNPSRSLRGDRQSPVDTRALPGSVLGYGAGTPVIPARGDSYTGGRLAGARHRRPSRRHCTHSPTENQDERNSTPPDHRAENCNELESGGSHFSPSSLPRRESVADSKGTSDERRTAPTGG